MTEQEAAMAHAKADAARIGAEERHARSGSPWTRTVLEAREREARIAFRAYAAAVDAVRA